MCGFTGFYAKNTATARPALYEACKAMTDAIAHRGPDSHGIWQDADVPLAFGHRRLAIIDLSPEGHQPMTSASGRYVINYNGEVYNYLDLQKELTAAGIKFRGRSDTEVILAAVDYWGLNLTLQKMNGMYAFALWDKKERQLHIVRDRLGKKPIYVGWAGGTLVFGSELKALRAHPDFKPEINREALALFMTHSAVPAPHCIYKGVWMLPAGFFMTINVESLQPGAELPAYMKSYWHHLNVVQDARLHMNLKPEVEIIQEFEALLGTCVKDRLMSDVNLGAFLSGGIDSSTVVALMQKFSSQPVKTYSIGFTQEGFNEAQHAKEIAAHLGTDHHEMYVDAKAALDTISLLPQIFDEPFGDASAIPTYLVSKFARSEVTVALSGDGGDEMLGGYNRHITAPALLARTKMIPAGIRGVLANFVQKIPTTALDAVNRGQPQFGTRVHKAASILSLETEEAIYKRLSSAWEIPPVLGVNGTETLLENSGYRPEGLSFAEKMMYWDALSYLPNDILTKVDRASMAVGLEARAPLLDKRIYEYVWRLPENYKLRGGKGKWLLRQVLKRHVPEAMFERPKQGFTMPVGEWLRGPLKGWADGLLNTEKMKADGFLDADAIRAIWDAHQRGEGNHDTKLWNVLMFQAWKQKWM